MIAACACAALLPFPSLPEGPLSPVRLNGNYFQRNGRPFIPAGGHWAPAKAAMQWPMEWEPSNEESAFRKMRELGVNTVRIDTVWPWFEPRPGDYNPAAFAQLDKLIELARRYGIYLQPSLLIGNEVGEAIRDVAWRNGHNPQADPEMLRRRDAAKTVTLTARNALAGAQSAGPDGAVPLNTTPLLFAYGNNHSLTVVAQKIVEYREPRQ
jgi:hypothetical protein